MGTNKLAPVHVGLPTPLFFEIVRSMPAEGLRAMLGRDGTREELLGHIEAMEDGRPSVCIYEATDDGELVPTDGDSVHPPYQLHRPVPKHVELAWAESQTEAELRRAGWRHSKAELLWEIADDPRPHACRIERGTAEPARHVAFEVQVAAER